MTSAINPQNIDGAYPVAGQDNDSQGFRDNFTNIKTNFTYAADEISDLQTKAVLKAALVGTVLNNDMGGSVLSNAQLQNMSETRVALGSAAGPQTINYAAGPYYTLTTADSVSLQFTNFPAAGTVGMCRVQITVSNVAHTLTLPSAVGSGASLTSTQYIEGWLSNVITFSATGTYVFEFTTSDNGTTIFIEDLTRTTGAQELNQLDNVTITSPVNNNVLKYNSSGNVWINGNVAITELANVSIVLPTNNQVLKFNAANSTWINGTAVVSTSLDDLTDVSIASAADGDFLVFDSTGNVWVNEPSDIIYPLTTYDVTIADNGSGTQEVFFFDGTALQTNTGVQFPIEFLVNQRYRFNVSDVSNADAPLRFSRTPDTAVPASITPYTTNVTVSGTAGTPGSYVEILITDTALSTLYFYGEEVDPAIDTSLIGAARPISVGQIDYCLGSDTFSANGAISLQTSATVITSSANLVATIAAGSTCQTKTLAYGNTATGNTQVTFTNAAWGGSGVANLSAVGSAATFQYIDSKWFCVGNNGVAFS